MRPVFRLPVFALVPVALFGLFGCVGNQTVPTPTPTPRPISILGVIPVGAATSPVKPTLTPTFLSSPAIEISPTLKPTNTVMAETEMNAVINAFAVCGGRYSGQEERNRRNAAESALDRNLHSVASIRTLVNKKCGDALPAMAETTQIKHTAIAPPTATLRPSVIDLPTATPRPSATPTISVMAVFEMEVHAGTNQARAQNGSSALKLDKDLAYIAKVHSDDMTERNYYSHRTPEGLNPTDRLHTAGLNCPDTRRAGIAEIITIVKIGNGAEQAGTRAVRSWLDSPGHRSILLNGKYNYTGVGASFGEWLGYRAIYFTQVFC